MTTAFAVLLLGVAVAALVLALGAYWWVNRTPPANERFDAYGRVPLFAVNLTPRETVANTHEAVNTTHRHSVAESPGVGRTGRTAEDVMADRPSPVGNPVLIDTSALDTAIPRLAIDGVSNGARSSFAPPVAQPAEQPAARNVLPPDAPTPNAPTPNAATPNAATPNAVPANAAPQLPASEVSHAEPATRPSRIGWGATPGWPVAAENGMMVTPKYVPPVHAETDHHPRHPAPATFNGHGISPNGVPPNGVPPNGVPANGVPANGVSANGVSANGVSANGIPGSMIEGHQLRFTAPTEGTLQFLPGRLDITTGLDAGREIRFVRVPGPNGTEVTFGRNEGPLYRHIQLRDQTVSREHARLLFAEGRWVLTNLSRTNPVAHNGRILRWAEEQPLTEGDRLEMGEVVFNFRSR